MRARSAEFASERHIHRRSNGEQRDIGTAGIARCREPWLLSIQSAWMARAHGKCRLLND